MAQSIHKLWMPYRKNEDGTIALLRYDGQAFGFSNIVMAMNFANTADDIALIMREELIMVDSRFPIIIDLVRGNTLS